jgi:hypothetical protein
MNEMSIYSESRYAAALQQADLLSKSDLLPKAFSGRPENCLIALELAERMGASPFMVAQNVDVIHGKPSFSAKFLIGCFNSCGRFEPITYDEDTQDGGRCRAISTVRSTGDRIEGPWVSLAMAKAEGWVSKNGSKWQTMPQMMLRYRAATFMIRTTAPELSLGLPTSDELIDTDGFSRQVQVANVTPKSNPFAGQLRPVITAPAEVVVEPVAEETAPVPSGSDRVRELIEQSKIKVKDLMGALVTLGIADGKTPVSELPDDVLHGVADDWETVLTVAFELKGGVA